MKIFRWRAVGAAWRFSLIALLLAATSPVWANVTEEEVVERTVALPAGAEVVVEATNGSIQVATWGNDEVRVVARKKARANSAAEALALLAKVEVKIEESGDSVRIAAEAPSSGWFGGDSASVSFEITMPAGAELDASSTNGSIEVRELGGRTRLETENGSITARGVGGPLEAKSNNGSIKAYDVRGSVQAKTTNGSIKADVAGTNLGDGVRLATTNGSIDLRLEAGIAASIAARTRNGSVKTDFPGAVQDRRKHTLDQELGGGGPRIELESSNGSIRVRER